MLSTILGVLTQKSSFEPAMHGRILPHMTLAISPNASYCKFMEGLFLRPAYWQRG